MARKSNFELEQSSSCNTSAYTKFIKEFEAKEIPVKYIDHVYVVFKNGTTVDVAGEDISVPISLTGKTDWSAMEDEIHKVHSVKIYINVKALEKYADTYIAYLFKDRLL